MQSSKHVCPKDGRCFKTKAALAQHTRMVHAANGSNRPSGSGSKRLRNGGAGNSNPSGVVFDPTNVGPTPGARVTEIGEDRFMEFKTSANLSQYTQIIEASMSPRLKTLSTAYQRIKFLSVTVNVTAQCSAMTSGGFIAGFIMDPDDAKVTKNSLQASQGSVVKKWYESTTIKMPATNTLFYTSRGNEPRFRSPGRFWIIIDSLPSTDVTVVCTVKWKVQLSHPTYDEEVQDFSFFLEGKQIVPVKGQYALKLCDPGSTDGEYDFSPVVPSGVLHSDADYVYWSVPTFNIEYSEGTGDTGTLECHFVAYRPSDKRMYYSQDGVKIDATVWQADVNPQVVVPCGSYLKHHDKCTKNALTRPSRQSSMFLDSPELARLLTRITSCLETLSGSSRRTSTDSGSILVVEHPEQD